jgi:protein-S-isoprenylcysteine O-methyltransferase Ste14
MRWSHEERCGFMSSFIANYPLDRQAVSEEPGIRWWRMKVACGFLLILGVALKYLEVTYPTFSHGYISLARVAAVIGGAVVIYHYLLLRRRYLQADPAARIVTSGGLFGLVRHPMYLGDVVMYLGLALLACNFLSIAVLVVAIVALVRQAGEEDAFLLKTYPAVYTPWARTTKRLIPGIY